jgi:nudix-type nucleoside diphosphatase (YffH/AdpP family)
VSGRRRVKIHPYSQNSLFKRLLDDFFKVDRYWVSYETYEKEDKDTSDSGRVSLKADRDEEKEEADHRLSPEELADKPKEQPEKGMSEYVRRLNFERGDAVGVLLFNRDTRAVVLVEQFKLPTLIGRRRDEPAAQDGWIVEVMAGMIRSTETAEDAAIRETREETGYVIGSPKLICKFLSSPGGTSERIFLYFATVTDSNRPGKGKYGVGDENIRVLERDVNELFDKLENGRIDDPKLAIAAYWLKDNMDLVEDLRPATVKFQVEGRSGLVGYKTGSIEDVKDVHAWVNPENTDMMMDRFMGKSISAKIRYLGSNRDEEDDTIIEDIIQESLRGAVGERAHVKIGTVLGTEPGKLGVTHSVKQLFHLAAAEGGLGEGAKVNPDNLKGFIKRVLLRVDRENGRFWRKFRKDNVESIIFPMIGAGEGGVRVEIAAKEIIPAAIDYFMATPDTTIKEIYFSAFKLRDKSACDDIFNKCCADGLIRRLTG